MGNVAERVQSIDAEFATPLAPWDIDTSGICGEPVGIRTRDLLIKSQLLYQLSYRPTQGGCIETSYPVVKDEISDTSCRSGKN